MIKPLLQDETFLASVRSASPDRLHLWWLGQSGYLIKWQDSHLLIDPYLSDSLSLKYAGTEKPHVRMTERVISPDQLDFIDVVTSSHNHTDHLDGDTLIPLLDKNPDLTVIISRANLNFAAERLKTPVERLTPIRADSDPVTVGPFTFHAIPSAHDVLETDENGDHKFIGYIISVGGITIYHSGDARPYQGLVERLNAWQIDLALLPVNGNDPSRGVAGNFSAAEAVQLGKAIHAGLVIPCHYDMFEFNTVSPESFTRLAQESQVPYLILQCGERFDP
jgi:L-ascorbate metabolism protein UlaG (beta-lactamase superfamily)